MQAKFRAVELLAERGDAIPVLLNLLLDARSLSSDIRDAASARSCRNHDARGENGSEHGYNTGCRSSHTQLLRRWAGQRTEHKQRALAAHLSRRSFWQDEAFTWSTVDRSFPSLLSVIVRHEGYQVLHSLIEWPTNRISSTVEALRMPSVFAFAGSVPAVWLVGRRLFDERTGVFAALLFALNGYALSYAQEARSYMLAAMLRAFLQQFFKVWLIRLELRSVSCTGQTLPARDAG